VTGRPAAFALVLALACACRGGGDPGASPEAAVRAFAAASQRGDVDAMRAVVATPERMGRALDCTGSLDQIAVLASARDKLRWRSGLIGELRGVDATERRTVARGDRFRDCKVVEPLEVETVRIRYVATGERKVREETGTAVHLDGHWRLLVP